MVAGQNANKMQNSMLNFKIVKCKNWEKDGTCKYGVHCTFAHGDTELRHKNDNLYQMQYVSNTKNVVFDTYSLVFEEMNMPVSNLTIRVSILLCY